VKIRARCRTHPNDDVLILHGTTKYWSPRGFFVTKESEEANVVELDEGNLYCTFDPTHALATPHDLYFEVVDEDALSMPSRGEVDHNTLDDRKIATEIHRRER
jgi:hypothetical protein